ncbi:beta-ketoacyl-[bacterium]|nr:beta-ketoacyl-[acyl-carrier-protein] synthase II [bacterium]
MIITAYEALCNIGNNINEIYENAINGNNSCFENFDNYLKGKKVRAGIVKCDLPSIAKDNYNIRCNRLLLKTLQLLNSDITRLINKYGKDRIAVVAASTNSGVDDFEKSGIKKHFEIGNPAEFLHKQLGLEGFYTTVSTACSSGIVAFSVARDLITKEVADAVIVACTDSLSKVPVYGFNSLEVLSDKPCNPFSKNRSGMNMGEASAIFIAEREAACGIEVMGIGQSSDIYHSTTPDPDGVEAVKAMQTALKEANIEPKDVDYINAHGTATMANDIMEATAINKVFGNNVPVSSTKAMTGHCLGAAAGIEIALCAKLLENFDGRLYPNIYDGEYDKNLPYISLVENGKIYKQCRICMCNSFGFGGTNAIIILGIVNEK